MATKYREELKRRLKTLIAEAGGQSAFSRKVWPKEPAEANKAKVSKWANGLSGISPEKEALAVARAFHRRPAWLLFGDLPEREGATRPEAALEYELANVVTVRALADANIEPSTKPPGWSAAHAVWMRDILATMIGGADLLGAIVRLTVEECESSAAWLETRARIAVAIKTLPDTARSDVARKELERAYANMQPPSGRVFRWRPVTFTPLAVPAAQRDLGSDAPVTKESEKKKGSPRAPKAKSKPTKWRK